MSRYDNSTPAEQRARNLHNAKVTNTKPPVQRSAVPNPVEPKTVVPVARNVPLTADVASPVGRPLGANPQPAPLTQGLAPRPNGSRFGNGVC